LPPQIPSTNAPEERKSPAYVVSALVGREMRGKKRITEKHETHNKCKLHDVKSENNPKKTQDVGGTGRE